MRSKLILLGAAALLVAVPGFGPAQADPAQDGLECIKLGPDGDPRKLMNLCGAALGSSLVSDKVKGKVHGSRGGAYQQRGQHDLAIKDFDDALREDSNNADARMRRGISFNATQQYDKAIKDFDTVIRNNPRNVRAHVERGRAFAGLGKLDEAVVNYNQAIEVDPDNAWAYYYRAYAYNGLGAQKEAVQDFDRAVKLGGQPVTRDLQIYLKSKGKYRGAIDGVYGRGSRAAVSACVKDPKC